jgi:uncharacterized protein (DUF2336 family)
MTVVTMRSRLTEADIRALVKGASDEDRGQAAFKICRTIDHSDLSDEDRAHAQAILQMMVADAAVAVRRAMALALKNSPRLPRDMAVKLANDLDSVALPILQHSPVLSDVDLIEILRAAGPSKQVAIAARPSLSTAVTGVIADIGASVALERALANDNAQFDQNGLNVAIGRVGERPALLETMVRRKTLPVTISERLVSMVSGELFDHLVNNHALPPQLAIDLASTARERATLDLVEQAMRQSDVGRFVQQLNLAGRITPSLIMRAVCQGYVGFVEHAVAELSGLPHHRVWLMIHDSGPLGLKTVFERAGLPGRMFPPFRAAIDLYHQMDRSADTSVEDRERFRQLMIERVLTLFQNIPREDLDYLLEKLDAASARPMRAAV